jgi:H+/Cl- antiporter ClcA
MKITMRNYTPPVIGMGILWSLVLFNYAFHSTTTFWIYSVALLATGFVVGSDLVFYYWAKDRKEKKYERRQKHPL